MKSGVPHDSPSHAKLEASAIIAACTNSHVVMTSGNSLAAEIENWLAGSSPWPSRTVAKRDAESVQSNFANIAAGMVRVT